MLQLGDTAPDFTLKTTTGELFRLADQRGKRAIVLYFYPKDDTPGCTAEACSFRDQYQDFQDLGAEVVGVSSDSEASHQKFTQKHLAARFRCSPIRAARCANSTKYHARCLAFCPAASPSLSIREESFATFSTL